MGAPAVSLNSLVVSMILHALRMSEHVENCCEHHEERGVDWGTNFGRTKSASAALVRSNLAVIRCAVGFDDFVILFWLTARNQRRNAVPMPTILWAAS